nr:hypothetical protein B0A51_10897 [Rachicladosporium sp. CCFEE 5018]
MRDRIPNLATRSAEIPHLNVVEAVVGGVTRKYLYLGCAAGDSSVKTNEDKWYGLVKLAPKGGGFAMNRYQMKTLLNGSLRPSSPDAANADTRRNVPTKLSLASSELPRSSDVRATRKRQRSEDRDPLHADNDSRNTLITPETLPHRGHEPAVKHEKLSVAIQGCSGDRPNPIALDSDVGETRDSFLHGTWQGNPNNDRELQKVITDHSRSTGSTTVVPDLATLRIAWRQRSQGYRVDETAAWIHWERMCMRRQAVMSAANQMGGIASGSKQQRVKVEKQDVVDLTEDD